MKAKTFIILFAVLCLLAGTAYLRFRGFEKDAKDRDIGNMPYASLPVASIQTIQVQSEAETILLERSDNLWVLKKKLNFPADFNRITGLVSGLKSMKIGRRFQASDEAKTRLGLRLPDAAETDADSTGIRIVIKDAKESTLADVVIGKTREMTAGAGGHYILDTPENTIYLVDIKFDKVGKTSLDWIEKDILDIKAEDIKAVSCTRLDGENVVYALARPDKGKAPVLTDDPAAAINPSALDDVMTALAPLTIDDVAGYAGESLESDVSWTHAFEYRLQNGAVYRFLPGSLGSGEDMTHVLKITAVKGPETGGADGGPAPMPVINAVIDKWVYVIPKWKFERFIPEREGLLEK